MPARCWAATAATAWHFRTAARREADLGLEALGRRVVGIDVKASASLSQGDFNGLREVASAAGKGFARGIVLYAGEQLLPFEQHLWVVPAGCAVDGLTREVASANNPGAGARSALGRLLACVSGNTWSFTEPAARTFARATLESSAKLPAVSLAQHHASIEVGCVEGDKGRRIDAAAVMGNWQLLYIMRVTLTPGNADA